jgi:hypothetical protein
VCQSRPLDRWGVAGYYLRTCRELPDFLEFGDEKGVEAFYTFALTPATLISADVQIVGSARQLVNTAAILRARICYVRSLSQAFAKLFSRGRQVSVLRAGDAHRDDVTDPGQRSIEQSFSAHVFENRARERDASTGFDFVMSELALSHSTAMRGLIPSSVYSTILLVCLMCPQASTKAYHPLLAYAFKIGGQADGAQTYP